VHSHFSHDLDVNSNVIGHLLESRPAIELSNFGPPLFSSGVQPVNMFSSISWPDCSSPGSKKDSPFRDPSVIGTLTTYYC
jgi:hypothetical protein